MFDGTFKPFSMAPEYVGVNRECATSWVNQIALSDLQVESVLDVATGVGTMANILMETLAHFGHLPTLTCLDNSKWALELARQNLEVGHKRVSFTVANVVTEELAGPFDVIVWANGIHYLRPDEHRTTIPKLKQALRPGGYFCFNTAFHAEGIPPETRPFYSMKVKEAAGLLRDQYHLERVRGLERKPAAQPQSTEHYRSVVEESGMKLVEVREHVVRGSLYFYQAIASFHDYAEGALLGYPVAEAAEALVKGTEIAFKQHGVEGEGGERFVERKWLSVIAQVR